MYNSPKNKFQLDSESHLLEIKLLLISIESTRFNIDDWIPHHVLKRFLNYGESQMRVIEKENNLITSQIGNRKFYKKSSIANLLNKNIK